MVRPPNSEVTVLRFASPVTNVSPFLMAVSAMRMSRSLIRMPLPPIFSFKASEHFFKGTILRGPFPTTPLTDTPHGTLGGQGLGSYLLERRTKPSPHLLACRAVEFIQLHVGGKQPPAGVGGDCDVALRDGIEFSGIEHVTRPMLTRAFDRHMSAPRGAKVPALSLRNGPSRGGDAQPGDGQLRAPRFRT